MCGGQHAGRRGGPQRPGALHPVEHRQSPASDELQRGDGVELRHAPPVRAVDRAVPGGLSGTGRIPRRIYLRHRGTGHLPDQPRWPDSDPVRPHRLDAERRNGHHLRHGGDVRLQDDPYRSTRSHLAGRFLRERHPVLRPGQAGRGPGRRPDVLHPSPRAAPGGQRVRGSDVRHLQHRSSRGQPRGAASGKPRGGHRDPLERVQHGGLRRRLLRGPEGREPAVQVLLRQFHRPQRCAGSQRGDH